MFFSELLENKVSESITFRGKKIDVVFCPERITQDEWKAVQADGNESQREQLTYELLAKSIDSWSIRMSETEDFPPTIENLQRPDFPHQLLLALVDRLMYCNSTAVGKFKVLKA